MTKDTLPTYAIVELLIRLENITPLIGSYKDHAIHTAGVVVKTTNGSIEFTKTLIRQQFEHPELISTEELKQVVANFKPAK